MNYTYRFLLTASFILQEASIYAQDPALPSANFGFNNMGAGIARKPGMYYASYLQTFHFSSVRNAQGAVIPGAPTRSAIISLQQLTLVSKTRFLSAQLCATALIPVVKSLSMESSGHAINPNAFGDLMLGAFIEGKRIFAKSPELNYRFGINIFFPTGAYNADYAVNPGAHRYRFFPHLECTFLPGKHFAISIKNNLYFYAREIGTPKKSGTAYNLNYALEFKVTERLTFEAAGYYLKQLEQDAYDGDKNYYQKNYGISDTRERVFAAGPGLGFKTNSAVTIEMKALWETAARNRPQGFRTNLLIAFPL